MGEGRTCMEWLREVWSISSLDQIQQFSVILWNLWKERCNHLFNNRKIDEDQIIPEAIGWLQAFLEAQDPPISSYVAQNQQRSSSASSGWIPPPEGTFKLNSDAGVLNQTGVGFGCVIRDWEGKFCGVMAKKERGSCRPIEAEAKAIVMGLCEANRRGLGPLMVESDCQLLIGKLENGETNFSELGVCCEDIKKLARCN
ncbi:unnamed protein product [Linum trigynum]|uniref:RNase H type-1 domain-containing protein n=1 Tax=Linum trigynum TaxID=586398 RepID=A0AAV2EXU5_9ROSI